MGLAKPSNTNELFLTGVGSHCLLLRKDCTFCFNISTGVWWAFSFLFLSRIFLLSWPGEGSMGSSEKSLSNKNFVTNFSPNTLWNIRNKWHITENSTAGACNNSLQLMAHLEDLGHLALLGQRAVVLYGDDDRHVWRDERVAIDGLDHLLWEREGLKEHGASCSFQSTYSELTGEASALFCKKQKATVCFQSKRVSWYNTNGNTYFCYSCNNKMTENYICYKN